MTERFKQLLDDELCESREFAAMSADIDIENDQWAGADDKKPETVLETIGTYGERIHERMLTAEKDSSKQWIPVHPFHP